MEHQLNFNTGLQQWCSQLCEQMQIKEKGWNGDYIILFYSDRITLWTWWFHLSQENKMGEIQKRHYYLL